MRDLFTNTWRGIALAAFLCASAQVLPMIYSPEARAGDGFGCAACGGCCLPCDCCPTCCCQTGCPGGAADPFGGPISQRPKLTGNWFGVRPALAESGITFDADVISLYQGVTAGGVRRNFAYGGHGDFVLNADFGKLGVQEGLFLKLRAEDRIGNTINANTGALLPAAVIGDLPSLNTRDLCLTNVVITQALSERFVVYGGKVDTFDGDLNAFASGRGKTQFMNIAFVANPVTFRTVVYSTLGGGLAFLSAEGTPLFNSSVLNTIDTSTSSGFNELFQNGATLSGETRLPVSFLGLPGHQLFGATYSTADYVSLTQDPRLLIPGGNVPIARKDGSWSAYWNFDQYLVSDLNNPTDGWGVFGRAGISDGDPNLAEWFLCLGVGGNSPLRRGDTFGIGWYRSGTSGRLFPRLRNVNLLNVDDGQGVELFYNARVTPWFRLTPDLQIIDPGNGAVPTALVVGFRGLMDF